MIRSNGGEVLNSYPLEEERKVDVKKLIVLAQPSGFRKTTFLLGLASGLFTDVYVFIVLLIWIVL